MNWAIGIDMYTLMCIKLMTNKNLLYKKINLKKLKNKENHPILEKCNLIPHWQLHKVIQSF